MTIEWFPGHMATARREADETMRKTDLVVEVLDARIPYSSCNPMLEALRQQHQRPALKLLNKIDVADPPRTQQWLEHYNARPDTTAIALSAKKAVDVARVPRLAQELLPLRGTRIKPLRLMILGVPNAGKSTLMNALLRRHVANVGDEPAITKDQMKHQLSPGIWIVDTPGMLWPGLAQDVAVKLAQAHSVGPNAYDNEHVAVELAAYLLAHYAALLSTRYGPLPSSCDANGVLAHIAAARSISSDVGARSAGVLLQDFRDGVLGRITLETVEECAVRRATADIDAAGRAAKKKAKTKKQQTTTTSRRR